MSDHSRLEHFPVTFFAIVMGGLMGGLVLALHAGVPAFPWLAPPVSAAVLGVAMLIFALVTAIYVAKALRYPRAIAEEWHHPVKIAFFPTMTISLLLMATALHVHRPELAEWIWKVGTLGGQGGVLTIAVVTGWISHRSFEVGHLTPPAWFIPAVGNVIVPVAGGARMGYIELSWLFFSGGMLFWLVLLTLVMNRLIFHDPIVARLFPTMVILIARPPWPSWPMWR